MGHLTRELGIARALEKWAKPIFVSLSQGVPVVNTFGFPFEYVPFTSALNSPPADWNRYFRARLARAIDTFDAKCVVFDGVWPYSGLVQAIRDKGVRSVWVRRGMWKPHISPDQLRTASHFDLVIEPGDYAASMDRGATAQVSDANKVEPVTVLSADELLERDAARRALRLPVDQKLALVTLGAGNINDIGDVQGAFVRAIQALGPDWRAVVTTPPIAERTGASAAYNVSVFPLARYANAFDFAVSATGYNSFHEWLVAGLPSIWVPNHATITDDQGARAEYADKVGLGISVDEPTRENIESAVSRMSDRSLQNEIRRRADALPRVNGSWQAAELIANLVRGVHI
jgi:UDP:flavonoid glycosyltransferase YjiC (YdhE family)